MTNSLQVITECSNATLYVWEKAQPFNFDYLTFILGGVRPPKDDELAGHIFGNPIYCTDDFRIYPLTKQQDKETERRCQGLSERMCEELKMYYPHFKTFNLAKRLEKYDLSLPDHEITFLTRGVFNTNNINLEKIKGVAAHLFVYNRLDVLAVPGSSIEENQLIASDDIAKKLGIEIF
ncbi:MAG: hypothetical protein WC781_00085 [Candidatus Pacearchaeota archaeon]|jgi:hypothetical protein